MTNGKRAGLYFRVSTDRQDGQNQRPEVVQLARARGYEVVDVFEEAVSAVKHRPEFQRMLVAAHAGKLDVLVVWSIDRFGRSMVGNLQAIMELDRIGVEVVSVRESWLDTGGPGVRSLLIGIVSWVAEEERRRISDRVRCGVLRAKRNGVHCGRKRKWVDLATARKLMREGKSLRKTAKALGVGSATLHRALEASKRCDPKGLSGVAVATA